MKVFSVKVAIVTHTDIDGVAGGALYVYLTKFKNGYEVYFTEPYLLHSTLKKVLEGDFSKIVVIDLGLNSNTHQVILNMVRESDVEFEWYDHHIWERDWIDSLSSLCKLFIDRSTCATGVVAKYIQTNGNGYDQEFVKEIVEAVCNADLFKFNHKLSPWFMRVVRRSDSDEWRMKVFQTLSKGTLWINEFTEKVIERIDSEIKDYSSIDESIVFGEINGVRVAVANKNEVENSFSAAYVIGRFNVDIVAITSNDGKVSLRSSSFNVRELALKLGGGGHPRASGFKLKIPWKIRVKRVVDRKAISKHVLNVILENLKSSLDTTP